MREIEKTVEIDAPPAAVWRVLTDFPAYGEWNPFIPSIAGNAQEGERLTMRLEPPGGKGMTIRPTVLAAEPDRELRWKGRLVVPGLFDGEHTFRIEPIDGQRSRFVHGERFTGILVGFVKGTLGKTEAGFEQMNAALKRRVEMHQ
ncbi:MAG: SRPBCC family protein [Gaiellaceae bacterium]